MKHKKDILEYIQNFDCELKSENDWLTTHLWIIRNELVSIIQGLRIEDILEKQYKLIEISKLHFGYSPVRDVLAESIPYRIVIGLSKILVGTKEYSLIKTINKMSQISEFNRNPITMNTINHIIEFINTSKTVEAVTTLRDGFYAHLDKKCVLSDCRIDVSIPLKHIDQNELIELLTLIKKLYDSSCDDVLPIDIEEINSDEVVKAFLYYK